MGSASRGLYERNSRSPWLDSQLSALVIRDHDRPKLRNSRASSLETHIAHLSPLQRIQRHLLPALPWSIAQLDTSGVDGSFRFGQGIEHLLRKVFTGSFGRDVQAGRARWGAYPEQLVISKRVLATWLTGRTIVTESPSVSRPRGWCRSWREPERAGLSRVAMYLEEIEKGYM